MVFDATIEERVKSRLILRLVLGRSRSGTSTVEVRLIFRKILTNL